MGISKLYPRTRYKITYNIELNDEIHKKQLNVKDKPNTKIIQDWKSELNEKFDFIFLTQ